MSPPITNPVSSRAVVLLLGFLLLASLTPTGARAGQMAVGTFNLLRVGMSEAEVITRAGLPDLDTSVGLDSTESEILLFDPDDGDTVVGAVREKQIAAVKELHYIPGPGEHDPHLTVVTIKSGRVAALERIKIFTRSSTRESATDHTGSSTVSDHDYKIQQLDRTIEAAQQYTETRERL